MSRELESPEAAAARLAAERLSAEERALLWQRIEAGVSHAPQRMRRERRALRFGAPALAAALLAAIWLLVRPPHDAPEAARAPALATACELDPHSAQLRLGAQCPERSVRVDGDDWSLAAGADVARVEHGARVISGRVQFRVRPRAAHDQFRVRVSHGEVRVVGTLFQIEQASARGAVSVSEGVIEFVWDDGTRERVAAGQTLRWPRVAPEPAAPAPPAEPKQAVPEAPRATKPAATTTTTTSDIDADIDRTLDRLLQLQSQKRFPEAVALLRATLQRPGMSAVQSERISYELGLALEASGSPDCTHWRQHVQRFGSERHAAAVERRLARCRTE